MRSLKPRDKIYRKFDERGLYLEVTPNGGRYWRIKYRVDGREKRLAIGVYPEVTLREARDARDAARCERRDSADPSASKRTRAATSDGQNP